MLGDPGSETEANGGRHVTSAISTALVHAKAKYYGRGPTKAKTYLNDDYIFCVMEGGLTDSEETLLRAGEHDVVRTYRLKFQEVMSPVLMAEIGQVVGRKVLSYHSQILFDPVRLVEIFVLEPEADRAGP